MFNIISIFYILLLFSSFLMILSNNAIYSVFFLISIFINTSIIFILFNVDFLGILLLLVYVGAIAILFLFIVMMLNIKKVENENNTYLILGFSIFSIFFIHFIYILFNMFFSYIPSNLLFNINEFFFYNYLNLMDETNNITLIKKIGIFLFLEYYLFLFFSGILLLISLIGAIFLTNLKKGYSTKTQYNQCLRKNNLINSHLL